jgi:hypothetical protein
MRFNGSVTIPAGTDFNHAVKSTMKLDYGNIVAVDIIFPAGSAGLAHLAIDHYTHQLYPTNPGGSFVGDDQVRTIPDGYPVLDAPFILTLRGWAPDAALDHTIYVEVTVLEPPYEAEQAPAAVALPEGFTT